MTLLFIILLLAALLISLYTLWHSRLKTGRKAILLINRVCIFAILYCAFFQPSFKVTRLASHDNIVPVLIDLSSSMQLFNVDSVLNSFSPQLQMPSQKKREVSSQFIFFGFGDSLRHISNVTALEFKDKNSIFPPYFTTHKIKKSRKILILSDGNWSNTVSQKNSIHKKECFYLPLQQVLYPQFIHIEAPNFLKSAVTDSIIQVPVTITGYKSHSDPLLLFCRRGQRILSEKKIQADYGFFIETASLPIPSKKIGSHLLELSAKLSDTITSTCYVMHDIMPNRFSAYLYSSHPSLDRRFIMLALARKTNWEIITDNSLHTEKPDACILFSWDIHAQQLLGKLPKSSVVFLGCLPCKNPTMHRVSHFTPTVALDFKHHFSTIEHSDFPPLTECLSCNAAPFTIQRTLITYDSASTKSDYRHYPLLFEAQFKDQLILAFAAKGLWRWDFWPKSIARKREAPLFSDFLIDRMQALAQYNTNRTFYVYPDLSPMYETDSLSFKLALPSYLYNFPTIHGDFSIRAFNGDTCYHSTLTIVPFQTHSLSMKTPPLKQGKYLYSCGITTERGRITGGDTITIFADNSEVRVSGQNTTMLGDFALPIASSDIPNLYTLFSDAQTIGHAKNETITRTVRINRSWFMLASIFILFCIEWILRKIWRLD